MVDGSCPSCSYANPLGSNFCSSCGQPMSHRASDDTKVHEPTVATPVVGEDGLVEEPTAMLVVRQGAKRGSRIALDSERIEIGRHPESDIFLDDITVSRRHAEILNVEGGHEVLDVGSLNGTYVNLDRADRVLLKDGDELRVGKFKLVYVVLGGDA